MSVAIITGSCGLVGSEAARFYHHKGLDVVGIDNDMRAYFFGKEASTGWQREALQKELPRYTHVQADIRDEAAVHSLLQKYGRDIALIVHTAAQPSHDWAAKEPLTDFGVNGTGTLVMLEGLRRYAADAPFIFTSTNKVYGDTPNRLPLVERQTRWEVASEHPYYVGIDEEMSLDHSTHSVFGASKVAADVLVQEYGRYFGLKTGTFRGGCLTGPNHSGTMLHGFLAYLAKCAVTGREYTVFGYKAKQVRDNIHSADLIAAFDAFFESPRAGEVYNMGGGRDSNISMLEAITTCERVTGQPMKWSYKDEARIGDHMWYITDFAKFQMHYPQWKITYDCDRILTEIIGENRDRWLTA
ncbi:MAG TPA: NAD-dependent epimerase/dehydratase family protein [Gemmatimonadaceae bacterium]|nr:NAD-dependent epimerase/dehydratase family protein [Gemmatimonadaceae bacterium]